MAARTGQRAPTTNNVVLWLLLVFGFLAAFWSQHLPFVDASSWCGHDIIMSRMATSSEQQDINAVAAQQYNHQHTPTTTTTMSRIATASLQWQGIRIAFFADSILNDVDNRTCYQEGVPFRRGDPPNTSILCNANRDFDCWDTCTSELVVTANKEQAVNNLLPAAIAAISARVNVNAVPSNLVFDNSTLICGAEGGVEIPEWMRTTGVPNADLVILVTMRPTPDAILAWGVSCVADQFGRPIMGQVNLSPRTVDSIAFSTQVSVTVHEMIHVLGFTSSKYSSYIGWNDPPRYMQTTTRSHNGEQMTINTLNSTNVLKVVRDHFGCNTLGGADLEEWGSQSTAGSHWEQRLFLNEIMTGSTLTNPGDGAVFSDLTLALLQDTGWYRASQIDFNNYTPLEMPLWGRGLGCDFALQRCETWPQFDTEGIDGYFCSKPFSYHCSFDLTSKGFCAISTYSPSLPPYYQHLDGDDTSGGRNPLADYCPYVEEYVNGDCRKPGNGPNGNPVDENSGEKWGNLSRCFRSSFVSQKSDPLRNSMNGKCYEYACGNDTLFLAIGKKWFSCPLAGGKIAVGKDDAAQVACPSYSTLCKQSEVTPNFAKVVLTVDEETDQFGPIIAFLWELFQKIHWVIWVVLLGIGVLVVAIILVIVLIKLRQKQNERKWKTTRTVNFREREMKERL